MFSLASTEGQGSVFTIEIPLAEGGDSRLPAEVIEAVAERG